MDKLLGYEVHFDLKKNEISIIKMANFDDERAVSITIRAANPTQLQHLKNSLAAENNVNFAADVQILS